MMSSVIPARLEFQCGHAALVSLPRVKGESAPERNERVSREKSAALGRQCDFCGPSVSVLVQAATAPRPASQRAPAPAPKASTNGVHGQHAADAVASAASPTGGLPASAPAPLVAEVVPPTSLQATSPTPATPAPEPVSAAPSTVETASPTAASPAPEPAKPRCKHGRTHPCRLRQHPQTRVLQAPPVLRYSRVSAAAEYCSSCVFSGGQPGSRAVQLPAPALVGTAPSTVERALGRLRQRRSRAGQPRREHGPNCVSNRSQPRSRAWPAPLRSRLAPLQARSHPRLQAPPAPSNECLQVPPALRQSRSAPLRARSKLRLQWRSARLPSPPVPLQSSVGAAPSTVEHSPTGSASAAPEPVKAEPEPVGTTPSTLKRARSGSASAAPEPVSPAPVGDGFQPQPAPLQSRRVPLHSRLAPLQARSNPRL